MNKLKVYLSGSVKNAEDGFQSWRSKCLMLAEDYDMNLNIIDPINYFDYSNNKPKTDKQCQDLFMWQIERCDILLCNLDGSDVSVGTGMEIEHAFCNNIPIIAFGSKPDTWYNWAKTRSAVIFETLDEALEYISISYGRVVN